MTSVSGVSLKSGALAEAEPHGRQDPEMTAASRRHFLVAAGTLYGSFGIMAALVQGGLPPIMRARGLPVESVSLLFVLYLPIGLSFIWAPVVDRWRLPFFGRRIGWIVVSQMVAIGGLAVVAVSETATPSLLFAYGLVIAFAVATMDLALDALAVEMTSERLKPFAAALKLGALALGSIIGGGVFVGMMVEFGWGLTFSAVALILLVCVLPVLNLIRDEKDTRSERQKSDGRLFADFRNAKMLKRLGIVVLVACAIFPMSALNRIMLVDLGLSLETNAWLVGTVQPLGLLGVSLVSGGLIRRFGNPMMGSVFLGLCLTSLGLMGVGFVSGNQAAAVTGAIAMTSGVGGVLVVMSTLILSWAEGSQTATSYAVLFNGSRLTGIVATVIVGKFVSSIGWPAFYAAGAGAIVLVSILFLTVARSSTATGREMASGQAST